MAKIPNCDTCQHFRAFGRDGTPPADFNPCRQGHAMTFTAPKSYADLDEWGFYRKGCPDRLVTKPRKLKPTTFPPLRSLPDA